MSLVTLAMKSSLGLATALMLRALADGTSAFLAAAEAIGVTFLGTILLAVAARLAMRIVDAVDADQRLDASRQRIARRSENRR